ncbi:MAG: hypothetical protein SWY16_11650 [Cyanobacteriota bacterium]|nr:hypothetical protein [Cyanobacteriota bacterium]
MSSASACIQSLVARLDRILESARSRDFQPQVAQLLEQHQTLANICLENICLANICHDLAIPTAIATNIDANISDPGDANADIRSFQLENCPPISMHSMQWPLLKGRSPERSSQKQPFQKQPIVPDATVEKPPPDRLAASGSMGPSR